MLFGLADLSIQERSIKMTSDVIERLRKDYLSLVNDGKRVETYDDLSNFSERSVSFARQLEATFYPSDVNGVRLNGRGINFQWSGNGGGAPDRIREAVFSLAMAVQSPPGYDPGSPNFSEEQQLFDFQKDYKKWRRRADRKARNLWEVLRDEIESLGSPEIKPPDTKDMTVSGFKVHTINVDFEDPGVDEQWEKVKKALSNARRKLSKSFPSLLKNQYTIVVTSDLSAGIAGKFVSYTPLDRGGAVVVGITPWSYVIDYLITIIHELAHKWWFQVPSRKFQEEWGRFIRSNNFEKHISRYARQHRDDSPADLAANEAFAETIARLMTKGAYGDDAWAQILGWLKRNLPELKESNDNEHDPLHEKRFQLLFGDTPKKHVEKLINNPPEVVYSPVSPKDRPKGFPRPIWNQNVKRPWTFSGRQDDPEAPRFTSKEEAEKRLPRLTREEVDAYRILQSRDPFKTLYLTLKKDGMRVMFDEAKTTESRYISVLDQGLKLRWSKHSKQIPYGGNSRSHSGTTWEMGNARSWGKRFNKYASVLALLRGVSVQESGPDYSEFGGLASPSLNEMNIGDFEKEASLTETPDEVHAPGRGLIQWYDGEFTGFFLSEKEGIAIYARDRITHPRIARSVGLSLQNYLHQLEHDPLAPVPDDPFNFDQYAPDQIKYAFEKSIGRVVSDDPSKVIVGPSGAEMHVGNKHRPPFTVKQMKSVLMEISEYVSKLPTGEIHFIDRIGRKKLGFRGYALDHALISFWSYRKQLIQGKALEGLRSIANREFSSYGSDEVFIELLGGVHTQLHNPEGWAGLPTLNSLLKNKPTPGDALKLTSEEKELLQRAIAKQHMRQDLNAKEQELVGIWKSHLGVGSRKQGRQATKGGFNSVAQHRDLMFKGLGDATITEDPDSIFIQGIGRVSYDKSGDEAGFFLSEKTGLMIYQDGATHSGLIYGINDAIIGTYQGERDLLEPSEVSTLSGGDIYERFHDVFGVMLDHIKNNDNPTFIINSNGKVMGWGDRSPFSQAEMKSALEEMSEWTYHPDSDIIKPEAGRRKLGFRVFNQRLYGVDFHFISFWANSNQLTKPVVKTLGAFIRNQNASVKHAFIETLDAQLGKVGLAGAPTLDELLKRKPVAADAMKLTSEEKELLQRAIAKAHVRQDLNAEEQELVNLWKSHLGVGSRKQGRQATKGGFNSVAQHRDLMFKGLGDATITEDPDMVELPKHPLLWGQHGAEAGMVISFREGLIYGGAFITHSDLTDALNNAYADVVRVHGSDIFSLESLRDDETVKMLFEDFLLKSTYLGSGDIDIYSERGSVVSRHNLSVKQMRSALEDITGLMDLNDQMQAFDSMDMRTSIGFRVFPINTEIADLIISFWVTGKDFAQTPKKVKKTFAKTVEALYTDNWESTLLEFMDTQVQDVGIENLPTLGSVLKNSPTPSQKMELTPEEKELLQRAIAKQHMRQDLNAKEQELVGIWKKALKVGSVKQAMQAFRAGFNSVAQHRDLMFKGLGDSTLI